MSALIADDIDDPAEQLKACAAGVRAMSVEELEDAAARLTSLSEEVEGWKGQYDRATRLHGATCRELDGFRGLAQNVVLAGTGQLIGGDENAVIDFLDAQASRLLSHAGPTWWPMAEAKKDRTPVLLLFKDPIAGRPDVADWFGLQIVGRHPGPGQRWLRLRLEHGRAGRPWRLSRRLVRGLAAASARTFPARLGGGRGARAMRRETSVPAPRPEACAERWDRALFLTPEHAGVLRQALREFQRYPTDPAAYGIAAQLLDDLGPA